MLHPVSDGLVPVERLPQLSPDRRHSIERWLTSVSLHSDEWSASRHGDEEQPHGAGENECEHIPLESDQTDLYINPPKATAPKLRGKRYSVTTSIIVHAPATVLAYRKACKRMRILPLRRVLAQFGRERVLLSGLCMSSSNVKATCTALKHENAANYLDLSGNNITEVECAHLVRLLRNNRAFTELVVADNRLSGAGMEMLGKFLPKYRFLSALDISGNHLADMDGDAVAWIIKHCGSLRILHVHHNEFREHGGKVIGKALAENRVLEELDLSWNHLRQHGAIGIARGIEKNERLEYINLAWNGFAFEGCAALSEALKHNTSLERLDISCNRIHPPALLELMKGVCANKVLKKLAMGHNPITPSFSTVLLEAIRKSKSMALEDLSLKGVVVDTDFQGVLEDIQQERKFRVCYETSLPVSCRDRGEMIREVEMRNSYNVEPLRMLYLLKEKYRAQDFFHKINKDHNDCLTPDELQALFQESGLAVSKFVIDRIMEFMDTDHDGRIDLGEFLAGDRKIKKISRDQARNSLQIGEEEHYSRYSRTFRKAHIQQVTSRLQVEETQRYLSPIVSLTASPASSRRSSIRYDT